MKVPGLLAKRGGSGKTTLAVHFAACAAQPGSRVLPIDPDPQRSSAGWWRARAADTRQLVETEPEKLRAILDAARDDGVDLAAMDTRPSGEVDAVQVATLADVIINPTRPAILDLRAVLGTPDIAKGGRKARVVLNACPAACGAVEASAAGDARKTLRAFGLPVARPTVAQHAAYSHALVAGLVATVAEPTGKAAAEMRALWRYVEKELAR